MALTVDELNAIADAVYNKFVANGVIVKFGNIPVDIWSYSLSDMTVEDVAGDQFKDTITVTKYLGLK